MTGVMSSARLAAQDGQRAAPALSVSSPEQAFRLPGRVPKTSPSRSAARSSVPRAKRRLARLTLSVPQEELESSAPGSRTVPKIRRLRPGFGALARRGWTMVTRSRASSINSASSSHIAAMR